MLTTALWGDVTEGFATPGGPTQPDFIDIAAIVEQFVLGPRALGQPRTQLQPNRPYVDRPVDFRDIADTVRAFVGTPYDYEGPCLCPSQVVCGETSCVQDEECGGGLCTDDFCRDACGRCTDP